MLKIAKTTKDLVFEGKTHSRAYWQGKEVWRKIHRINVDHGQSLDGVLEGVYDKDKKGFLVEEPDVLAPVITLNPDLEKINLKYGESFTLPQATAKDNKDPRPSLEIEILKDGQIVSDIDTKIPGDYQIIYTARDSSGNEAKKILLVKVDFTFSPYKNIVLNNSQVGIEVVNTASGYDKKYVIDGDLKTKEKRWHSNYSDKPFIEFTLPNLAEIDKIILYNGLYNNDNYYIPSTTIFIDGEKIGDFKVGEYKKETPFPTKAGKVVRLEFPAGTIRIYEIEIYGREII